MSTPRSVQLAWPGPNALYRGDNLGVLRDCIGDESVDLIYLDPPFNSDTDYHALFRQAGREDGGRIAARAEGFKDRWTWDEQAGIGYRRIRRCGRPRVAATIKGLHDSLGRSGLMAYLVMMVPRLVELHRVLKVSGSIYLHCDDTAGHYLKIVMDAVFGPQCYVNQVIWQRSRSRSLIRRSFRRAHDVLLFYAKSGKYRFNMQYRPLSAASLKLYGKRDRRGRYQAVPLLVSGRRGGLTGRPWRGIDPNTRGKAGMHWVTTPAKLDEYQRQGLVLWLRGRRGAPRLKYYLHQSPGVPLNDLWDDIPLLAAAEGESVSYPTQKPERLLERILLASSRAGDVVLDPFCGCGTTLVVAQRLGRRWIGADENSLAVDLARERLAGAFGREIEREYQVVTNRDRKGQKR